MTFSGLAVKLTGGAAFKLQFSSAGAASVESATFIVIPHGLAVNHPGVELMANLKSISHICHLFMVAYA